MFVVCEEGIEEQYDYCVGNIIPKYIKQGVSFEEIAIIVQYNKHAKELGIICEDKGIPYPLPHFQEIKPTRFHPVCRCILERFFRYRPPPSGIPDLPVSHVAGTYIFLLKKSSVHMR